MIENGQFPLQIVQGAVRKVDGQTQCERRPYFHSKSSIQIYPSAEAEHNEWGNSVYFQATEILPELENTNCSIGQPYLPRKGADNNTGTMDRALISSQEGMIYIRFESIDPALVDIELYDLLGMQRSFWQMNAHSGINEYSFSADQLPSGTYIVQIHSGTVYQSSTVHIIH
jgi:hypothetical protein